MSARTPTSAGKRSLFREEALRHHLLRRDYGDVLRLPPAWTRWAYPLVVATAAAAVLFLATVEVPRYAIGPAIVGAGARSAEAWLAADELRSLTAGAPASIVLDGTARGRVYGRVVAIAPVPELRDGRSVVAVRVALDPSPDAGPMLLAGTAGVADVRVGRDRWIALLVPGLGRRSR